LVALRELLAVEPLEREENVVQSIYEIIWKMERQFFDGLGKESSLYICRNLYYEEYDEDDPIYHQDEVPEGYYFILKGRVSIHARYEPIDPEEYAAVNNPESGYTTDDDYFPGSNALSSRVSSMGSIASASFDGFGESSLGSEVFNGILTESKDVKIKEISTTTNLKLRNMLNREKMYGEQLAQLTAGKGFGEADFLKFNPKEGLRRSTSAISDGDPMQQGLEVTLIHPHNTLFVLVVPKDIFMMEMLQVKMQKSDYERKVMWLKGNPVLRQLHHVSILRLGYEMIGPKRNRQGGFFFHKGDPRQYVYLVVSGQVKLEQISKGHPEINGGRFTKIDVALCNPGDMFGLMEHVTQSDNFQHTAFCTQNTEVYLLKKELVDEKVMSNPIVSQLLNKIVKERMGWEKLRIEFLMSHKTIHTTLTTNIMEFSKFSINHDSILTSAQLKLRRQNMKKLAQLLRESRAVLRAAKGKDNHKQYREARKKYEQVVDICMQAMILCETIGSQARTHYSEAVERADRARGLRRRLSIIKNKKRSNTLMQAAMKMKLNLEKHRINKSFEESTTCTDMDDESVEDLKTFAKQGRDALESKSAPAFLPHLPGKKKEYDVQSDLLKATNASTSQLKSNFESIRSAFCSSPSSGELLEVSRSARHRRSNVKLSSNSKKSKSLGLDEQNPADYSLAPSNNLCKQSDVRIPSPPTAIKPQFRKSKSFSPRRISFKTLNKI